jgi:uncharacterized membrane protein YczE
MSLRLRTFVASLRQHFPTSPHCWLLLFSGLLALGVGITMMIKADIGLGPWDVLHQGVSKHTGIPIGMVTILVGLVILLGWFPLGERPGVGTIFNMLLVGTFIDIFMQFMPAATWLPAQVLQMVAGVVIVGIGAGLYLSAEMGGGPRDGLMLALVRRSNYSVRLVRTLMELTALLTGWLLGGSVGVGTLAFAFGIGPVLQSTLGIVERWKNSTQACHGW